MLVLPLVAYEPAAAPRARALRAYAAAPSMRRGARYPDSDWWQYSRTKLMNLMVRGRQHSMKLCAVMGVPACS